LFRHCTDNSGYQGGRCTEFDINQNIARQIPDIRQHLGIPVVGAERPAMMEDNRLAVAPVLVEDLNAVLRSNEADFGLHKLAI
jgi:hypothetical protein